MAEGQNEAGPLICTSGPAISGEKPITPENLSGALNTTNLVGLLQAPPERETRGVTQGPAAPTHECY